MEENGLCNIDIDLTELFKLDATGQLKNEDFTRIWTDVVGLPMLRFEYIVRASEHTKNGYDVDQAVFYGLLIHISKELTYLRRITCKRVIDINTAFFHVRAILESCTRVQYFLNHPERIDDYRKNSIKPELKLKNLILENRKSRDGDFYKGEYEYEEGLLKSIQNSLIRAGNTEGKLARETNVYDMMKDLDLGSMYSSYATASHFIHPDWISTSIYSLKEQDGKFYPDYDDYEVDIRLLNPLLLICYDTIEKFITKYNGHKIEPQIIEELQSDKNLIIAFDRMHHNFLQKLPLNTDIDKFIQTDVV